MQVEAHIHGRPKIGEACSGDAGCVRTCEGVTWVLLVDALGHGPEAAEVAARAIDEHGRFSAALSVEQAFGRLHARLARTRGAAATLLRFGPSSIGFGGVGNVSLRTLAGPSLPFIASNGVLGWRALRLRTREIDATGSGRLLLFTDGVVPTAPFGSLSSLDAKALCETLIAEHSLARDDATVIHVSYRLQRIRAHEISPASRA